MDNKENYFAKALAWSVKSDFSYVKWLVDIVGFDEEAIGNKLVRLLYRAASITYARMAPAGNTPSLDDVVLEMENIAGSAIASEWGKRIELMEEPQLGTQREVATSIAEEYNKARVTGRVAEWLDGVKSGEVKGLIGKSFSDMVDGVSSILIGGQSTGRPRDILDEARSRGLVEPESTGYQRIDKALDGGWRPSEFYIFGMPTGHGKTSLCCNFASRRAEVGMPTIVHSMEMTAWMLLLRMICDLAEVSIDVAENPNRASTEEEMSRILYAEKLLDQYVRVYDTPADPGEMDRRIRRHRTEYGRKVILNEIDHIGIVRRNQQGYGEWSELESMAYSLVGIAQSNMVPVLAYSQVPGELEQELIQNNIVVYNRDFRGSKGLRNAVDYAIVGCRHNGIIDGKYEFAYANHTVVQVTKNRRTGRQFWGVFEYDPVHYRLTNNRNDWTKEDMHG